MKVLDIGCGNNKREGFIGLDCRKTPLVDIIANAEHLPFQDETFDYVYSSHLLEHFSHTKTHMILAEWVRVLKSKGTIEIRCPDLRSRAFLFFLFPNFQNVKNIYGSQDYNANYHKSGFSYSLLKQMMISQNIHNIKRVYQGYKGVPFLPDSLHVIGEKR